MKNFDDSIKLRLIKAFICLFISFVFLISLVISIVLAILITEAFIFLTLFSLIAFYIFVHETIGYFIEAVKIAKEE